MDSFVILLSIAYKSYIYCKFLLMKVNAPYLYSRQTGLYSIYLPQRDGRLS